MPGAPDTYMSYDVPWANVSTTPFRRYKRWVHEGGIATPCIVRWPATIKQPDLTHTPAQIIDITATLIDAAGASYPAEYDGHAITPPRRRELPRPPRRPRVVARKTYVLGARGQCRHPHRAVETGL